MNDSPIPCRRVDVTVMTKLRASGVLRLSPSSLLGCFYMYGSHSHLVIRTGPETCLFLNAVAIRKMKKMRIGKVFGEVFYLKSDITIPEVLTVAENLAANRSHEYNSSPLGNHDIERIMEGPSGLHGTHFM